ncbi:MAG TPA: LysR family transcriptional regulator [Ramlibacter sp.]|uniref:LysR family transcriptional regulator n=1 Tax=Ramlibacter sp. TaxID=1917967 RepID=UPI002ED671C9
MKALDTVRIFVITLQTGSLSAAGRSLGLSAATISRRITSLEEELGVQLLDRTSRSLEATEAGQIFLRRAESILEDMAQAENAVRHARQAPEGRLRVHSRTLVGIQLIAPLLREFSARYPDLTVDLHLSEGTVNLVEQNYDIDIRIGKLEDSSYVMRKLAAGERVLVTSPEYVASHPPVKTPEDLLQGHNCLTYRKAQEPTSWRYLQGDQVHELHITGTLHSNNGEVLRRAALSGLGLALLADWSVREDIQAGRLVRLLPEYRLSGSSFDNGVYALFRHTQMLPKRVRVFVDFLAGALAASGELRDS